MFGSPKVVISLKDTGRCIFRVSQQVSPRESKMIWDFHLIFDRAGVQTRLVKLYFEKEAEEAEDEAEAQQRPKEQKQKST
jgi:hypothetical protein